MPSGESRRKEIRRSKPEIRNKFELAKGRNDLEGKSRLDHSSHSVIWYCFELPACALDGLRRGRRASSFPTSPCPPIGRTRPVARTGYDVAGEFGGQPRWLLRIR